MLAIRDDLAITDKDGPGQRPGSQRESREIDLVPRPGSYEPDSVDDPLRSIKGKMEGIRPGDFIPILYC